MRHHVFTVFALLLLVSPASAQDQDHAAPIPRMEIHVDEVFALIAEATGRSVFPDPWLKHLVSNLGRRESHGHR